MAYIGSTPLSQSFAPGTDTFSGTGVTTAFTLSRNVATVNDIQVVVNNVVQQPSNYSVSSNILTFSPAPSSGTNNIYVRYLSTNLIAIVPQQGTVSPASLSTPNALYWDTSGNVGVGTTTPSTYVAKFAVSAPAYQYSAAYIAQNTLGTYYHTAFYNDTTQIGYQYSDGTNFGLASVGSTTGIVFLANGSERMRINASGDLLIGYPSQIWDERFLAYRSTNNVVGGFYSTSTSYTSSVIRAQTETAAGTGWYLFEGRAAGGSFQYGIRGNGTVATSDERRKKNIEPARSYIDDICKIRVVKYNWKSDEDTTPKELGWIAQEVAEVFPNMVVTHHDGPNDDQEVLLLKKEVFVPMLMKCIQEQQAMIEELKTKVAALEAR